MKAFIKENLFKIISLIPVCFIALGAFILNIYLNQFGIIDVALFDSRTIFVGFVALFQIVCFFFFWAMHILKYTCPNRIVFLIINCFLKSVVFTVAVATLLGNYDNSTNPELHPVFVVFLIIGIIITFIILESNSKGNLWNSGKLINKIIYILGLIYSTSSLIFSVYLIEKDQVLSEIYEVYNYLSIYFSLFLFIRWSREKHSIEPDEDVSKFTKTGKIGKLDYAFTVLYFIGAIMVFLMTYSKYVFPNISSNLGGGAYKYNTIIINDDSSITGKIIHSNSNYIYVIEEENKLSQYPITTIKAYAIQNDITNEAVVAP
ncbi:hypothetical protein, partial [Treponema sp.]|uniref:hypothetical protein n=1 Tax=Treponema sp. TaxID=166 RepID=UPI00388D8147